MKIKATALKKKEDDRGILFQNENRDIRDKMKHFFVSVSKPKAVRGQHYHTKKTEWFLVIKGKAKIYFEDLKTKEKDEVDVNADSPQIVEVPPMIAHAIKNIGKEKMMLLAIVNEPLDEDSPDTFSYKVI